MKHKLIIKTENKPGVLYRIADLFLRRRINIESLTVRETNHSSHISTFTVLVICDEDLIVKIENQIRRIVEVRDVRASQT